jgi:polysaccharide biosynthesis protein PslH
MKPPGRKPRVLLVTPFLPAPPVDGGKKRVHTLLRLLSDRYDFTLLSLLDDKEQLWHVPSLKKFCRAVVPVLLEQTEPSGPDAFFLPQIARHCHSAKFAAALAGLLKSDPPDLVHFEFVQTAQYRRLVPEGIPVVFTEHDVSNMSFFRSYFREMTGWRRWGRVAEWMRLVKYQIDACRWMDGIVTLTPHDTEKLQSYVPGARIKCVYTGVDLEHFKYRGPSPRKPEGEGKAGADLVYVGHYLHYPNEDAMLHFCRDVFPRIERRCPLARLGIVGSGPTQAIRALTANPRIRVTGTVPDVKPYLDRADVYVAPLRLGEGIKGKILEAFAAGVPVVASPTGAWGLEARDGEEFLVGRSARDFADKTVRLIFDAGLRARLVRNGRRLVTERYDWSRLAGAVGDFYDEFLSARKPG